MAAIGALNTVLIRDGRTVGHNTDVSGFRRSFLDALPDADRDRVVLVGAGGAGTAVAHALARPRRRPAARRRPRRGAGLEARARRCASIDTEVELVPATPDGLAAAMAGSRRPGQREPRWAWPRTPGSPVPARAAAAATCGSPTSSTGRWRPRCSAAPRAAGCTVLSGAGMAVHQAADAFELITGRAADRAAMLRDFDELVAAESTTATTPSSNDPTRDTTGERNR